MKETLIDVNATNRSTFSVPHRGGKKAVWISYQSSDIVKRDYDCKE